MKEYKHATWNGIKYVSCINNPKFIDFEKINKLSFIYYLEKMKQENVYNDYISYMDEKAAYDKQQQQLEQDRQNAYQEALKTNPNLTYEEFLSAQPTTLAVNVEPQPSQALQEFMKKYL